MKIPVYVLVTPARDEAAFIEQTIQSVVAQTHIPKRWVIVDDGSSDGTSEIVQQYAAAHPWIDLLRMPKRRERHFAGKVQAFNAGWARLKDLEYAVIGSLDADISFDPEYFLFLLKKLAEDPSLGLIGTPFQEGANPIYDYRFVNIHHVSGACQLFRRECFEEIGGYVSVPGGCIDHIAVLTARMKGWKTRTFPEKVCHHHRAMDTAGRGWVAAMFRRGVKDYSVGNHPVWEICRAAYQMAKRPYVAGGALLLGGYAWSLLHRRVRPVSNELMAFQRREQMERLFRFFIARSRASQGSGAKSTRASIPAERAG